MKDDDEPLNKLVNSLYPSCKDACAFEYVNMGVHQYNTELDINVESTVEVLAREAVPPNVMERARTSKNTTEFLNMQEYLPSIVSRIEEITRGQSSNEVWVEFRKGMITGSSIHDVYTKVETITSTNNRSKDVGPLLNKLTGRTKVNSDIVSLKYGRLTEPEALSSYSKLLTRMGHKQVKVTSCGLFVLADTPYIGASPDGLVTCACCGNGLVEIKCPSSISHTEPAVTNLNYLEEKQDGTIGLKHTDRYYSQIQAEMAVSHRIWCDLFVYTRHGNFIERIVFDEKRWESLLKNAKYFMTHYLAKELLSTVQNTEVTTPASSCPPKTVSTPAMPISTPVMPVSTPAIPISTPAMPVSTPAMPVATPTMPVSTPTIPVVVTARAVPSTSTSSQFLQPAPKHTQQKRTSRRKRKERASRPVYMCPCCNMECKDFEPEDDCDESEYSVMCEGCHYWYHWGCVRYKEVDNWFCKDCAPTTKDNTK